MPKRIHPRVTDHAIVRYLERARGFDIEEVRRHIAALCTPAMNAGSHCLHAENVRFILANMTVITVEPNGTMPSETQQRRLAIRHQQQGVGR